MSHHNNPFGRSSADHVSLPLPIGCDPLLPCPCRPGSPEKIAVLQHRYELGIFPMHHVDDCRDHSPVESPGLSIDPSGTLDEDENEDFYGE